MSSPTRTQLEPAFVLHRRAYRETSLLVEVLSRAHGRSGLIAKGARTKRSGLYATLQPFQPLLLSWVTRGEMGTLTSAEHAGVPAPFSGATLASGFYLNELLVRLLHRGDPHPELFDQYAVTLEALRGPAMAEAVLRIFEKRLLQEIGYGMVMDVDAAGGGPVDATREYVYEVERGPVPVAGQTPNGVRVSGRTLIAFAAERLDDPTTLREVKRLTRYVLRTYLGERPLASRALLKAPL